MTLVLVGGAGPLPATPLTGEQLLRQALDLRAGITDYTAEVWVTVNMPGITVPPRVATAYFKRPDKVHIESKGVVMIPRQALLMGSLGSDLAAESLVTLIGTRTEGGVPLHCIKIIPTGRRASSDRVLMWIRGDRYTVERLEMQAGGQRQVAVQWEHQLVGGRHWLPRRVVAKVPSRQHGGGGAAGSTEGTVQVEFRHFKVNTGLSDKLFTSPARPRRERR